jgi:hypothetical protein
MTKLTIQHEWKNYKWKGDKWGHDTIKAFKIEKLHFMDWVYTVDVSRNWYQFVETRHSPEQLVTLGYIEEIIPNQ